VRRWNGASALPTLAHRQPSIVSTLFTFDEQSECPFEKSAIMAWQRGHQKPGAHTAGQAMLCWVVGAVPVEFPRPFLEGLDLAGRWFLTGAVTERILIAMSGGVDSSVAAARLVQQGYEVIGVTLHLWDNPNPNMVRGRCCAPEDVYDAKQVATALGIPHYSFQRLELFRKEVVEPFVDGYLSGQTPSPCVHCNLRIKFPVLLSLADRLGARRIATGHYARLVEREGRLELHRGCDPKKDQSYFLHGLLGENLRRVVFPLAESQKTEVRAEALRLGLHGASKGESQELCFVPTGRYDTFVEQYADGRLRPGAIVDEQGRVLGKHEGIHRFTIGQRRNLGVAVGTRAYVVDIDVETGCVRLGPKEALLSQRARLAEPVLASDLELPILVDCAVRYHGQLHPARVERDESGAVWVIFSHAVSAVVRGQFAVFFQGERVVGGGQIL
jgi:tRNA-uridine 2-sulfurtransferase